MFKVRSDADDIIDGDSDDDDDHNILDPNLADDDDPQPKNSGDYEDGGK